MTSPGEEATGRTVCIKRQKDLRHAKIWISTDSSPEKTGDAHLLMVTSPSSETSRRSWPHSFSNIRRPRWASGRVVRGSRYWEFTAASTAAPKPNWRAICLWSELWTQPVTKWVFFFFQHTHTHAHTLTHTLRPPPVLPEHLGTWTNTHYKTHNKPLMAQKPAEQQREAQPVQRGPLLPSSLCSGGSDWSKANWTRWPLTSNEETGGVPVLLVISTLL